MLITGATGSGRTWLGCALAHQAARSVFSVLYVRAARLFDELQVAHGDGSFARRLAALAELDQLVIDDFAISLIGPPERQTGHEYMARSGRLRRPGRGLESEDQFKPRTGPDATLAGLRLRLIVDGWATFAPGTCAPPRRALDDAV